MSVLLSIFYTSILISLGSILING